MSDSPWYQDAIFYEVFLRAFADGNGDGHGDFAGLTARLDYFQDLGVDCLWLMPIYPSPLVDAGYDIADYFGIHPDYGTLDDFKAFMAAARARGLRVICDLVLNHTSDQHPWYQAARPSRGSRYRDYYVWSDSDEKYREARIIFLDVLKSNWTFEPQSGQFYWHRFYPQQPDLNYDNPAVRAAMQDVIHHWLSLGLDGFRADAVPYLFEREGTNCENLPETHAYLKQLRAFLDDHYPGRVLLAEANQWPADVRDYFGQGDEFHMAFHFPVMPRIFMALAREDATPIREILAATPPIPETCQWCTFLRNHDELTLEMVTPDEREWMWQTYAPEPRMRLNLGIRRRLAPLLGGDPRRIALAHALLFSLPGAPIVYYGDEIGMGDDIWRPDRDGVRTPMQWDSGPNAGFSAAPPAALYAPPIAGGPYGYQRVNVAAQRADPGSLWHQLRALIAARKAQPALGHGDFSIVALPDPAVLAVVRRTGSESVVAVHNLAGRPARVSLDLSVWAGVPVRNLFAARVDGPPASAAFELTLAPYAFAWLVPAEARA